VTLPDGSVLVMFRRAPEPRWLLGPQAPENLRQWVSHVHERSHHAMIRLDGKTLKPLAPAVALPMNPLAADQDSSLLLTRHGRLILGSFAWYGFPPVFVEQVKPMVFGLHGGPQRDGQYFAFFGGFVRVSDDGGRTWSEHNYLPPLPDAGDLIPGKWPRHGGAVRGRAVESEGEILLPVYASRNVASRSAAYVYVSTDGGNSWKYRTCVARDEANKVHMHEPAFHRCPSGKIVCFIRTANLEDHLVTAESPDNGRTWSAWKQQEVIGHPYNPLALPGGGVLLVYGYRHQPFGIRARVLDDECADFGGSEIVIRDDGTGTDLGYPWATLLPDGRVLVTYYISGADGVRHIAGTILENR
jgi:hypothetical protein